MLYLTIFTFSSFYLGEIIMGYLFIFGAVISMLLSDTAKKCFYKKCTFFFAFISCIFADLFFVFASGFKFDFNKDIIIYSVFFALSYSLAVLFLTFAYKEGSFSFSGLVISYSLLLPTLYGIIFLRDDTSLFFYIGLALLCIATFLICYKKENKNAPGNNKSLNFKWVMFISLAFIGNGFCTIFQTTEQTLFNGMYKNEFMIIALSISALVFLIFSLFMEKKHIKDGFRPSILFGSISGLFNGALNLFVMYSVNHLNSSIVFPLISGGGLILTFFIARIFFKEKYSLVQYFGFIISVASVVLLNL